MEYIQTVLFQIPASRIDQAAAPGGLLAELDGHREHLRAQPGFRDIRITRSINQQGNILVVVQTRWDDDTSLLRYETNEPNAGNIVRSHAELIVPDSLQVLDMESLRAESAAAAEAGAHTRAMYPIVVPAGILAFALLVIYGLSRIYLELSRDAGVGLAVGIAIAVLLIAFYIASTPKVPAWQIGAILALGAAALIGGTIWAESQGGGATSGQATSASPGASPAASPAASGGATGTALTITMNDNVFNPTELKVKAGETVTITADNKGAAIHNLHVASPDGSYKEPFCNPSGAEPCSDPNTVSPGTPAKITWKVPNTPGATIPFRCDFHQPTMAGTIKIQ